MSITITYDDNLATRFGSVVGIKGYMDYYSSTYASPGHAANMGFDGNPGSNVEIGSTSYYNVYPGLGIPIIGKYMHNTSASSNVDFLVTGGEVPVEGATQGQRTIDYMFYTGPYNHTLSGYIDSLVFGGDGYNSTTHELNTELFTITGLGAAIGNGFKDTETPVGDGWYDAIHDRNDPNGPNLVHELILDLMGGGTSGVGGPYGPGSTSVLEDYLDAYGTNQVGTAGYDQFDGFAGADTFVTNGGSDVIRVFGSNDSVDVSSYEFFEGATAQDVYDYYTSYVEIFGGGYVVSDGLGNEALIFLASGASFGADNLIV